MHQHPSLPGLFVLLSLLGACNTASSPGQDSGTLDTAPCDSIFEGTYLVGNQEDLDALSEYCEVTGSLSIYRSSLTSFSIPQITAVGETLSVTSNDSLTSFSLPNLSAVSSDVMVESNGALLSFELPSLTEVGDGPFNNVWVEHNDALTSFDLSALTRVSGSLFVRFNAALSAFELSALTRLGGYLGVSDNDALAQCLVDALVAQVEAGEGIESGVDTTGGPNNPACTCEEVAGVLQATCP